MSIRVSGQAAGAVRTETGIRGVADIRRDVYEKSPEYCAAKIKNRKIALLHFAKAAKWTFICVAGTAHYLQATNIAFIALTGLSFAYGLTFKRGSLRAMIKSCSETRITKYRSGAPKRIISYTNPLMIIKTGLIIGISSVAFTYILKYALMNGVSGIVRMSSSYIFGRMINNRLDVILKPR